jgi:hypothetical protein
MKPLETEIVSETALTTREAMPVDTVRPQPTVADMLQAVIERGVTQESVAAVGQLVTLYERMQEKDAEKAFAAAFVALQAEMPKVKATKVIPDKHGNVRSTFAPFEEIDAQARPLCLKHGFTYVFSEGESSQPGRITKICTLQHVGGHKRSNPFTVRIGNGPPGCSEAQADGAAHSYAKRGALCDALNIVVTGMDTDVKMEGGNITQEQADQLEKRVALLNIEHPKFLKWLGASKYSEVAASKYHLADEELSKRERAK